MPSERPNDRTGFLADLAGFAQDRGQLITSKEMRTLAYRDAAKKAHPESTHANRSTDPATWERLQQALSLLEAQ